MGKSRWTLAALCLGTFMLLLDITIVQVALPSIGREFHSDLGGLQWTVDAYVLPLSALIVTLGTLADRHGRRRVFLGGVVVFTLASLVCGLAGSPAVLDAARAVQGVGGAAMFATTLALVGQEFTGQARGRAISVWGATVGAAVATGPLLGGILTEAAGWRWIFLVNVPVGIVTARMTLRHVAPGRDPHPRPVDLVGALTLVAGLGFVTVGLLRGSASDWTGVGPIAAVVAGGVFLAGWAVLQRRPGAMIDRSLYRSAGFLGVTAATLTLGAGMFAMLLYLTIFLQNVLGASPLQGGLELLPFAGLVFVVPIAARRVGLQLVSGRTLGVALACVGAGLGLMTLADATSSWDRLLPGLLLSGLGVGLANPAIAASALAVVEPVRAGLASGVSNACRIAGMSLGVAGLGVAQRQAITGRVSSVAAHRRLVDLIASGQLRGAGRLTHTSTVLAAYTHGLHVTLLLGSVVVLLGAATAAVLLPRRSLASGKQPLATATPDTAVA